MPAPCFDVRNSKPVRCIIRKLAGIKLEAGARIVRGHEAWRDLALIPIECENAPSKNAPSKNVQSENAAITG